MTATPRYYPAEDVPVSKKSVAVKRNVSCTLRRLRQCFGVGCGARVIHASMGGCSLHPRKLVLAWKLMKFEPIEWNLYSPCSSWNSLSPCNDLLASSNSKVHYPWNGSHPSSWTIPRKACSLSESLRIWPSFSIWTIQNQWSPTPSRKSSIRHCYIDEGWCFRRRCCQY